MSLSFSVSFIDIDDLLFYIVFLYRRFLLFGISICRLGGGSLNIDPQNIPNVKWPFINIQDENETI